MAGLIPPERPEVRFVFLLVVILVFVSAPAGAAWHRATSPHFIIYADESPAKLRAFAEKLERFDKAVRIARSMKDPPVGDGGRLTVLVVPGVLDVRMLKPGTGSAAGFYTPRYWGSVAVVPRLLASNSTSTPETIFFHEYAHHLMFSDFATPIPAWLVEGFAEFMSTADVNQDGSVGLGAGAVHRAGTLRKPGRATVPLEVLLSGKQLRSDAEVSALYARGWLLAHYLTFNGARRGQIEAYLAAIAAGRPQLEAARATFGDLRRLDQELDAYLKADKFPYLTIPAARVAIGAVSVEPLGPGSRNYVPLMMRIQVGVDREKRPGLAADARRLAVAYPADPQMAMVLGSALIYNEEFAAADAAADRAIALNPQSAEALILKARALTGRAKAGDKSVSFASVRGIANRANRLDPENPEPLVLFYRSFLDQRIPVTANAIAALHYASDLAPHDLGLRFESARRFLADGNAAKARARLVPLAYNPHGGRMAQQAQAMIAQIDSGQASAAAAATPVQEPGESKE
jgi:Flp pilus assembly protein TadD